VAREGYRDSLGRLIISIVYRGVRKASLSLCSRGCSCIIKRGFVMYRKRRQHSKKRRGRQILIYKTP
jgi:hypothetical protein